ncbi:MAG: tetratricopeptide repeat protein [Planctomycetota bacterium]|nr:tetratricopeptide repeat protein [Planctomycetota bacterium]
MSILRAVFLLFPLATALAAAQQEDAVVRAHRLFQAGRYADAVELLTPALEKDAERADAQALLGYAYFELERYDEARAALNHALALGRMTPALLSRLAHIALQKERLPHAVNSLRLAGLLAPDDNDVQQAAADAAAQAGLSDEALAGYRDILKVDPARADVWLRAGNLHLRAGRNADALRMLLTGYHLGGSSAPLERTLAELLVDAGNARAAVDFYERLLSRKPVDRAALELRCARLLAAAGDGAGAQARAMKLSTGGDPALAGDAHVLLGQLAAARGVLDKAFTHWRKAARNGRVSPDVDAWLGSYLRRKGEHAAAVEHLRRRLQAGPWDARIAGNLVASLIATRDFEGARKELLALLERTGLDDRTRGLIASLARAGRTIHKKQS